MTVIAEHYILCTKWLWPKTLCGWFGVANMDRLKIWPNWL